MDFCPLVCGFEQSWMKAVPKRGCPLWRDCPACADALLRRVLHPSNKTSRRIGIYVWRIGDSVQHNKNRVLLFALILIMRRVELVALNFIVFLQVILFFSLPCLFLLDFWEDSVFAV